MHTRAWRVSLAGIIALLGLAAAAYLLTDDRERRVAGPGTPGAAASRFGDPDLAAVLSVFRRQLDASDTVTMTADQEQLHQSVALPGEDLRQRRHVPIPGYVGGMNVWPASGAVCYSYVGGAGCIRSHRIIRSPGVGIGLTKGGTLPPGVVRVGGVARDGISSMVIQVQGGQSVVAPVRQNLFLKDVLGVPRVLRWREGNRRGEIDITIPARRDE